MPSKAISRARILIFSLVPVIALLILGEMGLRVWAYYFRTPYERYNFSTHRLQLVPNIRLITGDGNEFLINSLGFVGPEFEPKKSHGTIRIFALGDSCTFGSGYWKHAYPGILGRLLNSARRGQRYEVINAGIEGSDSEHALARLQDELIRYEPDIVIVYVGWNDLMKLDPSNQTPDHRFAKIARMLETSYLAKAYRKLVFFYIRPLLTKPPLAGMDKDAGAFDTFVPMRFRSNLQQMIDILHRHRITPLIVTLPTAVRLDMTYDELKAQQVFFPYYAGSYSVGKFLALHRSYNNVIRNLAVQSGVRIVDLDLIFRAYDWEPLFWDTMHPNSVGHLLIAKSLAPPIEAIAQERGMPTRPFARVLPPHSE